MRRKLSGENLDESNSFISSTDRSSGPPESGELELIELRRDQIDFRTATLHVRRVKQGNTPSTNPILADKLRALRRLHRGREPKSPFVFTSEPGAPFATAGFARMIERAGTVAKPSFKADFWVGQQVGLPRVNRRRIVPSKRRSRRSTLSVAPRPQTSPPP
jgi:hypothetical protein